MPVHDAVRINCKNGATEYQGWMDGVKVPLCNRGMTVEAARQCTKDRKEWRALAHMQLNEFHAAIFAWPCVPLDLDPVL